MVNKRENGLLGRLEERVKQIQKDLKTDATRLNNHSARINSLEKFEASSSEPIFRVEELMTRVDELESYKDKHSYIPKDIDDIWKHINSLNKHKYKVIGIAITIPVIIALVSYVIHLIIG